MLKHLIRVSLSHPWMVLVFAVAMMAWVGYSMRLMPVDVFPELNAPTVVVLTETRGLAADETEQYVTLPIEAAVNGMPGVRRVRSSSAISLSIVWVELDWGEDLHRARQMVAERLSGLESALPEGVHAEIAPITSITGEIMLVSVASPDGSVSPMDLRAYAEYDLRTRLLSVPGIAQVVAIGGELPEYQVNINPEKLRLRNISFAEVTEAARAAHSTASGGYIPNVEGRELPIRQQAAVKSVADIRATVVRSAPGAVLTLGDVAEVTLAGAPKRGTGSEAGRPAVVLSIAKSPGTNTRTLTDAVDRVLDTAEPLLPKGALLNRHVMRQADFIDISLTNVLHVLRDAAIFVSIILILFLLNVRTTIITLAAMPLSLAATLLVMYFTGLTINVMTLGGLAVAIGVLVDDAIIDVENVHRRLGEHWRQPIPGARSDQTVIFDASNEIRSSMVFATVIIVLVFVPMLFLEGLEGRFFRPLGLVYIISILASLLVALTVTPALCGLLLRRPKKAVSGHREPIMVRWIKRLYSPSLAFALKHRWTVVISSTLLAGASLWFASGFWSSFLPEFNEGTFTVFLMMPPGTSLAESDRLAIGVEQRLAAIDGVRGVVRRTGRAEKDEHAEPVSSSEIEVSLMPGRSKAEIRAGIDEILASVPSVTTMVGQPIEHRLSHVLSGTPAAVAISIYGDDLDVLRAVAKDLEGALRTLPGARDVNANREIMVDTLPVEYNRAALALHGLTPAGAAEQVRAAFSGETVGTVNQGVRQYAIVVRLAPPLRDSVRDLRDFELQTPGGGRVPLSSVARIGIERASNLIARENMRRRAIVSCNVAEGYNLGQLVAEVRAKVDPTVTARGLTAAYGGQFEAQQSASRTIALFGAGVVAVIVVLLTMAFSSFRAAMLVMVNLPLSLIGGVAAVFWMASPDPLGNLAALFGGGDKPYISPVISIPTMVGFVTLFGIAVRNGILLVNHYQSLMNSGHSVRVAITRGSAERLVPILMTALCAALGLVPLALAAGEPGSELLGPLAAVVLGGLVTSTFLNLVVVPAGFLILFGARATASATTAPTSNSPSNPTDHSHSQGDSP